MKVGDSSDDKRSLDSVIVGFKSVAGWMENLEKVKKYIDENGKRPSGTSKNKYIKCLASFITHTNQNYNNKNRNMKNKIIYDTWTNFITNEKYYKYFLNNKEEWKHKFEIIKKFIDINKHKPTANEKTLFNWINTQNTNFKNIKLIMKDTEIYNIWKEFINDYKYKEYFKNNDDRWLFNFQCLKDFYKVYKKAPCTTSKNIEESKIGKWLVMQKQNFKNKKTTIMKYYDIWYTFIQNDEYIELFKSKHNKWDNNLKLLINFIDKNNYKPSKLSKNIIEIKLSRWIQGNMSYYENKNCIFWNKYYYNKWQNFINSSKYSKYFISIVDEWKLNFTQLIKFIDTNNNTPSSSDKNENIRALGNWQNRQIKNYKNKKSILFEYKELNLLWEEFTNNQLYKDYYINIIDEWYNNLNLVKEYLNKNNKRPSSESKDINLKKLGSWIMNQTQNFKNKARIMKNIAIYKAWETFINDDMYKIYFLSNEEFWKYNFNNLIKFIDINKKRPVKERFDKNEKYLGQWISHNIKNYKHKTQIMKNIEIYNIWKEFITNPLYSKYF
jgi:hypothetical protein